MVTTLCVAEKIMNRCNVDLFKNNMVPTVRLDNFVSATSPQVPPKEKSK